jgi:hypothetical protein
MHHFGIQPTKPGHHFAVIVTPSDMRRFGAWAGKTFAAAPWQGLEKRIGLERRFKIHHTCLLTMTTDGVLVPQAHCQSPGLPDEAVMGDRTLSLSWRPVVLDTLSLETADRNLCFADPLRVFGSNTMPDAVEEWAVSLALHLYERQVQPERLGPPRFMAWIVDHLGAQIFNATNLSGPLHRTNAA